MLRNKAPKISGSEGDVDIFVNVKRGYDFYISADCNKCQYKDTIVGDKDDSFSCESPEGFECPTSSYQSKVAVTIAGDLRDRDLEETSKEIDDFIEFIKKEVAFEIRILSITAHEDWNGKDKTWSLSWEKCWKGEDIDV